MMFPKDAPIRLTGEAKAELRRQCMERDEWTCQECGRKVSDHYPDWYELKAHMSHTKSLGAGGGDTLSNVRTLCLRDHMVGNHNPKSVPAK